MDTVILSTLSRSRCARDIRAVRSTEAILTTTLTASTTIGEELKGVAGWIF
jgi:hypothetical protein